MKELLKFLRTHKFRRVVAFKIKVIYKSGATHEFEVTSFSMTRGSVEWAHVSDENKPILFGFDDVAAVYQVGTRKIWRFIEK